MMKFFLILGIALGVITAIGDRADAATADGRTECGQTINWSSNSLYAPDDAENAIRWAYSQVGNVTGTDAVSSNDEDISWDWQHPMSGSTYRPGETYLDQSVFRDDEFWTHALDGDVLEPSAARIKQEVLRLVVADFGVKGPTSTANGLSTKDRAALEAICKAQAKPDPAVEDNGPTEEPNGDTNGGNVNEVTDEDTDEDAINAPVGTPTPGGSAGLWLVLLLLGLLFVYALSGEKVLTVVMRARGRTEPTNGDESA